jgi:regulator of cell morphogenesis and NO signaling
MRQPNIHSTLREWLAYRPGVSQLFSKYGIDLCKEADRSLADLCGEKRLDPLILANDLERMARTSHCELGADWEAAPLSELCRHLEETHHAFYLRELPRLARLATKVAATYSATHPETSELEGAFLRFRTQLESHVSREKRELFPAILEMMELEPPAEPPDIACLITLLEQEHDAIDAELVRLRKLTHGFVAPSYGCQTFQSLLDGLWELEMNLHQDVYEETRFLFPRAIRHKAALCAAGHAKS